MGTTLLMPSMATTLVSLLVVLLSLCGWGPCAFLLLAMRLALVYGLDLVEAQKSNRSAEAFVPHIYVREANVCLVLIRMCSGGRRCSEGTFSLRLFIEVTLKG